MTTSLPFLATSHQAVDYDGSKTKHHLPCFGQEGGSDYRIYDATIQNQGIHMGGSRRGFGCNLLGDVNLRRRHVNRFRIHR